MDHQEQPRDLVVEDLKSLIITRGRSEVNGPAFPTHNIKAIPYYHQNIPPRSRLSLAPESYEFCLGEFLAVINREGNESFKLVLQTIIDSAGNLAFAAEEYGYKTNSNTAMVDFMRWAESLWFLIAHNYINKIDPIVEEDYVSWVVQKSDTIANHPVKVSRRKLQEEGIALVSKLDSRINLAEITNNPESTTSGLSMELLAQIKELNQIELAEALVNTIDAILSKKATVSAGILVIPRGNLAMATTFYQDLSAWLENRKSEVAEF